MNLRTRNMGGYPDWFRVVRKRGDDGFSKPVEDVIYEGNGVFFGSGQMRKFTYGNVVKADFCIETPEILEGQFEVKSGDFISVEGRCSNCEVVLSSPDKVFGLGTTIFFNNVFN